MGLTKNDKIGKSEEKQTEIDRNLKINAQKVITTEQNEPVSYKIPDKQ